MLSVVITFLITWMTIGLLCFILSESTLKQSLIETPVIMFMLIIGWIPCVIVGRDLEDKYY